MSSKGFLERGVPAGALMGACVGSPPSPARLSLWGASWLGAEPNLLPHWAWGRSADASMASFPGPCLPHVCLEEEEMGGASVGPDACVFMRTCRGMCPSLPWASRATCRPTLLQIQELAGQRVALWCGC